MKFKNWLNLLEASMHPEIKQDAMAFIKRTISNYFSGGGEKSPFIKGKHVFEDFVLHLKDKNNNIVEINVDLYFGIADYDNDESDQDLDDIIYDLKQYRFPNFDNPTDSHHFYSINSSHEEETTYEKEFEDYKKAHASIKPVLAKNLQDFEADEGSKKNAVIKIDVEMHPSANLKNVNQNQLSIDIMKEIEKEIDSILK